MATREDPRFFELITQVRETLAGGHGGDPSQPGAAPEELF